MRSARLRGVHSCSHSCLYSKNASTSRIYAAPPVVRQTRPLPLPTLCARGVRIMLVFSTIGVVHETDLINFKAETERDRAETETATESSISFANSLRLTLQPPCAVICAVSLESILSNKASNEPQHIILLVLLDRKSVV